MTTLATAKNPFKSGSTASNMCGFTLMNNQVGVVVAAYCDAMSNVTVTPLPSKIRVDGAGRMIHTDDRAIMFANPEGAAG